MTELEKVYALMDLQFELLEFMASEIRRFYSGDEINLETLKVLVKNTAISADTLENLSRAILRHIEKEGKIALQTRDESR